MSDSSTILSCLLKTIHLIWYLVKVSQESNSISSLLSPRFVMSSPLPNPTTFCLERNNSMSFPRPLKDSNTVITFFQLQLRGQNPVA